MSAMLPVRERTRLASCETRIERGLATFVEVGEALLEVRDSRLYRAEHETFEDYCRARWQISRPRAYELMHASEVVGAVSAIADTPAPPNEAVARELAPLRDDPEKLREAWQDAVEEHGPAPTAAQVREKVRPADPEPSGFDRWSKQTTADIERRHALTTYFWPAMKAVYRIKSSLDPALAELARQDRKIAAEIADDCAHAIDLVHRAARRSATPSQHAGGREMSMDTVRATLREEIDDQVAKHGAWDHGRVVAATVDRLRPFTHLDLGEVVAYAVRNLAQAAGRRKEHASRRAYQRVVRDGERVNQPIERDARLFELRDVIKDYRTGIRRDEKALAYYEAVQDAFIAGLGERPVTTTTIGEVVDLDAVATDAQKEAA